MTVMAGAYYDPLVRDAYTALMRKMVGNRSMKKLSREMGRAPNYLYSTIRDGRVPSVITFARIANACGCKLLLVCEDGEIFSLKGEMGR